MSPIRLRALLLVLLLVLPGQARAGEVIVAAASDLNFAIKELAATFEKTTKHTVKLSLGSSGNFHAQITNGAPFDVFLSADLNYVRDLEKRGLTEPGSSHTYAIGRIVLWVPRGSPIPIESGMKSLLAPQARKIAIANPEHAPYGRAAVEAMKKAGVYNSVKSRLVLGENISQTAQFVHSGAADIGIIALSLASSDTMKSGGRSWEIPMNTYPVMEQGVVILKQASKSGHSAAARAFLEALRSEQGRAILRRYGFVEPK